MIAKRKLIRLHERAEQDDSVAQVELAQRLATGDGVTQDLSLAFEWYSKAAALGSPDATYHMGLMYLLGEGVTPNVARAVDLFQDAARLGSDDAHFLLAEAYVEGKLNLPVDALKAVAHYLDACQCGGALRSIPAIGRLVRDSKLDAAALIQLMCEYNQRPESGFKSEVKT